MATVIIEKSNRKQTLPSFLAGVLPPSLYLELESLVKRGVVIEEIRLRADRRVYVSSGGTNFPLGYIFERSMIEDVVQSLCDGSMYAHAESIRNGYLTVDGGVRVGIVGRACVENGKIVGVYDVSGLCIRIPNDVKVTGAQVRELLKDPSIGAGVLVYSPPGEGKTTLLRAVSLAMASGSDALRVAVVDQRGELGAFLSETDACIDVLSGYPKAEGIEIAARSMNAQLIVCDEIGGEAEVKAMIAAQNCGVPLLASAHAANIDGLLRRTGIAAMHRAAIFGAYVGIRRIKGEREYRYTVTRYEEADERFKNSWCFDNCR